ncbi:MAG: flagellar type III secretion system protein FliR [Peptococcaceae bacterium]|nr:flagellar type III secretion system protein FliR [Candidatus Syntrophopropionicum ammoniitolerans]
MRVIAFMVSGPLYAIKGIPPLFKVASSLALAVVIYPVVEFEFPLPAGTWGFGLAVVSEIGVGLLLGFAVTMILNSIRMAGAFIDLQIGYAMSNVVGPSTGTMGTLLSQYLYLLGLVFFLVINGHHTLIIALTKSYLFVPLSTAAFSGAISPVLLNIFAGTFTFGFQVAAPILAVVLVTDLALGFLTRTTPQINVFLTGFPIKITVGLLTLSFLVPFYGSVFSSLLGTIEKDLYSLLEVLR